MIQIILNMSGQYYIANFRDVNLGLSQKSKQNPDEMAHYGPSYLDIHCLQRYMFRSERLKEISCLLILEIGDPRFCLSFVM